MVVVVCGGFSWRMWKIMETSGIVVEDVVVAGGAAVETVIGAAVVESAHAVRVTREMFVLVLQCVASLVVIYLI